MEMKINLIPRDGNSSDFNVRHFLIFYCHALTHISKQQKSNCNATRFGFLWMRESECAKTVLQYLVYFLVYKWSTMKTDSTTIKPTSTPQRKELFSKDTSPPANSQLKTVSSFTLKTFLYLLPLTGGFNLLNLW